jgi:hypothetical protein
MFSNLKCKIVIVLAFFSQILIAQKKTELEK